MKIRLPGFGRELRRMAIWAAAAGCARLGRRLPKPRPARRAYQVTAGLLKEFKREVGREKRRMQES